jgi:hypothetical protein
MKKWTWVFLVISLIIIVTIASPLFSFLFGMGKIANEIAKDAQREREAKWVQISPVLSDGSMVAGENQINILIGKKSTFGISQQNLDLSGGVWAITNPAIAKVDKTGIVEGLKEGKTSVSFTTKDGKYNAEYAINIYQPVSSFTVKKPEVTINIGDTYKPSYSVIPSTAKIIPVLAQLGPSGEIYYNGDGTIELKPDGTIVALKSGIGVVGYRYGVDQVKDSHITLLEPGNGYIGIAKIRVLLDSKEYIKYLEDTQFFIDGILKSTELEYINQARDELASIYIERLSKAQMDNPNFQKLKKQILQTNTALELFFNTFGSDRNTKDKRTLLQLTEKLKLILAEVKSNVNN